MEQTPLPFDKPPSRKQRSLAGKTGVQRRNEGLAQVDESAKRIAEAWRTAAHALVLRIVGRNGTACSHEITPLLPTPTGLSPNAWGAMFGGMSKRGEIHRIDMVRSRLPINNAAWVAVWALGPGPEKE